MSQDLCSLWIPFEEVKQVEVKQMLAESQTGKKDPAHTVFVLLGQVYRYYAYVYLA
jgi:hypothetical protein